MNLRNVPYFPRPLFPRPLFPVPYFLQEDVYQKELIRYIHLNPLRAGIVADLKALDKYRYCGHGVLMGRVTAQWQDTVSVTGLFDEQLPTARRRYRMFVKNGIGQGKRDDLVGGGLVRSAGGWEEVKALRKAKSPQKGDERILGDGEFVQSILEQANEALDKKYRLKAKGVDLDIVAKKAAEVVGINPLLIWQRGKQPEIVRARSLFCYWATNELGITQADLSRKLSISGPAVSISVARGRALAIKLECRL